MLPFYSIRSGFWKKLHPSGLRPRFQVRNYERNTIADLSKQVLDDHSRGHQEDARRKAVLEFVAFLQGKKFKPISDFCDHARSVTLSTGVYQSMANRFVGKNPIISLPFNKQSK